MSRPPVSVERLDLTAQGQVRYCLKTPYRDGTTHIVLEPMDFIARLAALVPPPPDSEFAADRRRRARGTIGAQSPYGLALGVSDGCGRESRSR